LGAARASECQGGAVYPVAYVIDAV
jgi:hypothetical protein